MSRSGFRSFLILSVLWLVPSQTGLAASSLVFPRISSEANALTGLAIANLSSETATLTLTAYGSNGELLTGPGFTNPATLSIPSHQQVAKLVSELFSGSFPAGDIAWVHLTSPTDHLTGFFLFLNGSLTQLDGADLPEASTQIIFNTAQVGQGFSTELNLVNTSAQDTTATLTLVQPGSASPLEQSMSLAGRGVARVDAGTLFGVTSLPAGSYVRVATDGGTIAGLEFVRSDSGDLLGINARKATEKLSHLYFPQLVVGGPWQTELGLVNYSSDPTLVTIYARKPDGTLYGGEDLTANPVSRGLNPGEGLRVDVSELFGFSGQDAREGWLDVQASAESVNGFLSYGIPSVGSLAAIAATPDARESSVFSHMASTGGFFTGLAILNPSSLTANVRILAFTPSGELLGRSDTVIRPKQRLSRLITEFIPGTTNHSNGFVWIRSDVPLFSSSLFGAQKVLANVPPQEPPSEFAPDENLDRLSLAPALAVVQPGKTQKFTASGVPGPVSWSVNGIAAGDPSVGTIDSTGLYQAPSSKPEPSVITISAASGDLSGGASVDVLSSQSLISGLGVLQSIVYMQSLQRLYEVELSGLSLQAAGRGTSLQVTSGDASELFQVQPPNVKTSVRQFDDNIVKLIAYPASDGKEYMLLLGKSSGQILRLEPISGASRIVYTGLNQPMSMALDSATGSVLVAEADRITQVTRTFIEGGLASASSRTKTDTAPGSPTSASTVALAGGITGIAVDRCTGEIYFSVAAEGVINAYDPVTDSVRVLVSGLSSPGQLLVLYRDGMPCPERTQLLVAEPGAERITLIAPSIGEVVSWISAPGVRDLSFIPPDNPFNLTTSVAYGLFVVDTGNISIVDVGDQYDTEPPVEEHEVCQSTVSFEDANLEAAVRETLGLDPEEPITCEAAASLSVLDASGRNIRRIGGLEFFVNLEVINLSHNFIRSLAPAGSLLKLRELDASYNLVTSPGLSANLTQLSKLDLSYNLISDLSTLINLDVGSPGSPARVRARRALALPALSELSLSFNLISDISALSSLTSLRVLGLSGNFAIEDLTPLESLTGIEVLDLQWNLIRDLTPLSALTELHSLDLRHNRVFRLSPLLDNPGIGAGDQISIAHNPIDLSNCVVFEALRERGVEFDIDLPCDVDLSVVLSTQNTTVSYGDLLQIRAQVSNLGTASAQHPSLHVELDPYLSLLSVSGGSATCTLGADSVDCQWETLDGSTSASVQVRAIVQRRTGDLINRAEISADQTESNTSNNQDSLTTELSTADLEVSKIATPSPAYTDGNMNYSITVTNHGPARASGVQMSDSLPSGFAVETYSTSAGSCSYDSDSRLLSCEIPSLSAGASAVISVDGTVTAGPGELQNSANVTASEGDADMGNNSVSITTPVVQPDLLVTKAASIDPAVTGAGLDYTITFTNNGTGAATNLAILDVLPAALQFDGYVLPGGTCNFVNGLLNCTLPSLAAQASTILTVNTTVTGVVTSINNQVSVTEDETDANLDDNAVLLTTAVVQQTDLSVSESVLPTLIRNDDDITYTVLVSNLGPSPANSVSLVDVLPVDLNYQSATSSQGTCSPDQFFQQVTCDIGSMASGDTVTVQVVVNYNGEANGTTFTNDVSVSGAETDPNLTNNSASITTPLAESDLMVTLTDDPDPVLSGNTFTLTETVTNLGPDTANLVSTYLYAVIGGPTATMISAVPSQGSCTLSTFNTISCSLGTLAPGASATVAVTADAPAITSGDTVSNTVSANGLERDPDNSNNSATETTTVSPLG